MPQRYITTPRRPSGSYLPPKPQEFTVDTTQTQQFWYDDPTFNDLVGNLQLPPASYLNFQVNGFSGGGFALGTPQAQSAGCYIGISNALNFVKDKTKNPIQGWAATGQLQVVPRAGIDFNAFYDRSAIRLFFKNDPVSNKTVYSCEATVVYVHELGHAVLDIIRPDFWSIGALEIHAYHEGFADCFAILNLLTYDPVVQRAIQQTGGNLRQSNILSQLAVELGSAIFRTHRPLRDAWNEFNYTNPQSLPYNAPDNTLSQEPHNFSRVWSGAFYDMLVSIYEKLVAQGWDQTSALKNTRDICARYLMFATAVAPATPQFYDGLARAILAVDAANGSPYQDVLSGTFSRKQILQNRMSAMSNRTLNELQPSEKDEVLKSDHGTAICFKNTISTKLSESGVVLPQDDNPYYDALVDLSADHFVHFNSKGEMVEEIQPDMGAVLDAALSLIQHLHKNDLVGNDKPWKLIDGKLVRQYYANEGEYVNNAQVKGAPEYGKPWKPQNNSGCCSTCKPKKKEEARLPVKLGCVVRDTSSCQGSRTVRTSKIVRTKAC